MKKSKEIRLTITQLAEASGFARGTLYRYIKAGSIFRDKEGLIPLARSENRRFLKENGIYPVSIKVPEARLAGRRPDGAPAPVKSTPMGESRPELQRKHLVEKIRKLEIENAKKRGDLLEIEKVRFSVFFYLDTVFNNLERLANTFLDDTANQIVLAGGLAAETRHAWKNRVLEEIDRAKNETVKRLEKLSKGEKV